MLIFVKGDGLGLHFIVSRGEAPFFLSEHKIEISVYASVDFSPVDHILRDHAFYKSFLTKAATWFYKEGAMPIFATRDGLGLHS